MSNPERQPGTILLGKYEIKRLLGRGGGGIVYLAQDHALKRLVAVKELINTTETRQNGFFQEMSARFEQEAQLNAQFTGYPVITIYGRELDDNGNVYLIMEFANKGSLLDLLNQKQRKPLSLTEFYPLAFNILQAIKAVHNHPMDIVHRDIKPSNLLLTDRGALLSDFGIAQLAYESARSRALGRGHPGTPLYMSPEQEREQGYLDTVGLVFYEMLTGQPFKRNRILPASKVNPEIPPMLDYLVSHAIEADRDKRYNSAEDMLKDLDKAVKGEMPPEVTVADGWNAKTELIRPGGKPLGNTTKPESVHIIQKKKRVPIAIIVIGLVAFVAIGVGSLFLFTSGNTSTPQVSAAATATIAPTTLPTIAPTATIAPTLTPTTAPTVTSAPTATPTVAPTATTRPTNTPAPTVVPTATTAPVEATTAPAVQPTAPVVSGGTSNTGLPFEDNFRGGAKPDWRPNNEPGNGKWAVDNGAYTLFTGNKGAVSIGNSDWENYSFKVKISSLPRNWRDGERGQVKIVVRYQDESNYLYLDIGWDRVQWISIRDGKPTPLNRQPIEIDTGLIELSIVVQGSNVYAYIGTKELAKFEPTTQDTKDLVPSKGNAGFRIELKNTTVPPRFENVTISKV
jgi:serine/threonine protein kinase